MLRSVRILISALALTAVLGGRAPQALAAAPAAPIAPARPAAEVEK